MTGITVGLYLMKWSNRIDHSVMKGIADEQLDYYVIESTGKDGVYAVLAITGEDF